MQRRTNHKGRVWTSADGSQPKAIHQGNCSTWPGAGEEQRLGPWTLSFPDIAQHNACWRSWPVLVTAAWEGKIGLMSQTQSSRPPGCITILLPSAMVRPPRVFWTPRLSLSPREWEEERPFSLSSAIEMQNEGDAELNEKQPILVLLLICLWPSGKSANLSEPQFPQQ